jgi:hypothetical protein
MKKSLVLAAFLLGFVFICPGQQSTAWENWTPLIGDWVGEGSGQPGQGGGTFSFSFDLDNKIILRKSHSEYPSAEGKSVIVHDDLMIIYPDPAGNPVKAIYFDNEGHIINYAVSYQDNVIVLTSDKITNSPVFRLVYTLLDTGTINTRFEISQDGEKFSPYIEGKSKRIN